VEDKITKMHKIKNIFHTDLIFMIKRINYDGKEIIIVGTAHVSQKSVELAEKTILEENPDCIGIELDKDRLEQLMAGTKWKEMNIIEVIKSGKTYLLLLNIMMANLQKKIGKSIGIEPGAEMLASIKKSQELQKPIVLLDRDVKVTLKRTLNSMSLIEKGKFLFSIIGGFFVAEKKLGVEEIEALKDEDLLNKLMKELGKQFPSMKKALVDERDEFIAEMIVHSPGKKIVAIVGAGHTSGIIEALERKNKPDLRKLLETNDKKNYLWFLKYLIPASIIAIIAYGFYVKGASLGLDILIAWFVSTGFFASLGALIARAHPLSILTAFVVAPFTVLHPALAAGWFSALAESKFNPPRVMDFESISSINGIGSLYKNRVTRLLVIAALTNIGATIGTLIILPHILSLL
jgi:pheromone shutdown-related protein TraB